MSERVYIYDTTLRDGAQTQGVDFSAADKAAIAKKLDELGVDYIEGGWPGANPTDDAFFATPPAFKKARLSAFGMTRRSGRSADNDPGLGAILSTPAKVATIVGKSWDFQVTEALGISLDENLTIIEDSIRHALTKVDEVMFDAEHFFDGFKANPDYALNCIKAAFKGGARWIVLCDTNGGTLPHNVSTAVSEVTKHIPGTHLGVHCHNDTGNAVANSIAAVMAGVRQVQGTLNGLGERCGNANLITLIPNLMLKMGFETGINDLKKLSSTSRLLDEYLNRPHDRGAPYVGESAFTHKGGLHVSAVEKNPTCYEHINPELVGNRRHIVVSNQAGRSNIIAALRDFGLEIDANDPKVLKLLEEIKERESFGYTYDGAGASLELFARKALGETLPTFFELRSYRALVTGIGDESLSEGTVKGWTHVDGQKKEFMEVAEGNGPIDALNYALRKALVPSFSQLAAINLTDYKVRILTPSDGSAAVVRVMIESSDQITTWSTVGVSQNVITASLQALMDSINYKLLRSQASYDQI